MRSETRLRAQCGRRVTLPMAARRRKVHSTPFPPGGENCDRFLALPLPGEPASLGFAGSTGELTKTPPGTAPEEHRSGAPSCLSPDPRLRGLPLGLAENFWREKSERYSKFPPGHWALALRKISNGAVPMPRLALFSQRSRSIFRCRGAQCAPAGRRGQGRHTWASRKRPDEGIGPYKRSNAPSDTS